MSLPTEQQSPPPLELILQIFCRFFVFPAVKKSYHKRFAQNWIQEKLFITEHFENQAITSFCMSHLKNFASGLEEGILRPMTEGGENVR